MVVDQPPQSATPEMEVTPSQETKVGTLHALNEGVLSECSISDTAVAPSIAPVDRVREEASSP